MSQKPPDLPPTETPNSSGSNLWRMTVPKTPVFWTLLSQSTENCYTVLEVKSTGFPRLAPCTERNSAEESRTFRNLYATKSENIVKPTDMPRKSPLHKRNWIGFIPGAILSRSSGGGSQNRRSQLENFQQLACLVSILVSTDQDTKYTNSGQQKDYEICAPLSPDISHYSTREQKWQVSHSSKPF